MRREQIGMRCKAGRRNHIRDSREKLQRGSAPDLTRPFGLRRNASPALSPTLRRVTPFAADGFARTSALRRNASHSPY